MERDDLKRPRIGNTGEMIFYRKTISSLKKGSWMNTSSPQVTITNRRVFGKILWLIPFLDVPLYKIREIEPKKERIGHSVRVVYERGKLATFYFTRAEKAKEFLDALKHAKDNYL